MSDFPCKRHQVLAENRLVHFAAVVVSGNGEASTEFFYRDPILAYNRASLYNIRQMNFAGYRFPLYSDDSYEDVERKLLFAFGRKLEPQPFIPLPELWASSPRFRSIAFILDTTLTGFPFELVDIMLTFVGDDTWERALLNRHMKEIVEEQEKMGMVRKEDTCFASVNMIVMADRLPVTSFLHTEWIPRQSLVDRDLVNRYGKYAPEACRQSAHWSLFQDEMYVTLIPEFAPEKPEVEDWSFPFYT